MSKLSDLIYRTETRELTQWVADIHMDTADGEHYVLTAGPRLNAGLTQEVSSSEIAEIYLTLSTEYLVTNQGKILPRSQITQTQVLNRAALTSWSRRVWFNYFHSRWRRNIDKPSDVC